jgi:hemerythrin-like metal-binding protein
MLIFNDSLKVNIRRIDDQHKKLFDIFNQLAEAMKAKSGSEIIGNILDELQEYAKYHFTTEEELFNKHNYPDAPSHIREHKHYIDTTSKFIEDFKENKKIGLPVGVFNFMTQWINQHIKETDKKYSAFLNEKGEY